MKILLRVGEVFILVDVLGYIAFAIWNRITLSRKIEKEMEDRKRDE